MLRTCAPETLEIPGSALTGCPERQQLETTAIREYDGDSATQHIDHTTLQLRRSMRATSQLRNFAFVCALQWL
jgi:hypothetical protein